MHTVHVYVYHGALLTSIIPKTTFIRWGSSSTACTYVRIAYAVWRPFTDFDFCYNTIYAVYCIIPKPIHYCPGSQPLCKHCSFLSGWWVVLLWWRWLQGLLVQWEDRWVCWFSWWRQGTCWRHLWSECLIRVFVKCFLRHAPIVLSSNSSLCFFSLCLSFSVLNSYNN